MKTREYEMRSEKEQTNDKIEARQEHLTNKMQVKCNNTKIKPSKNKKHGMKDIQLQMKEKEENGTRNGK